MGHGGDGQHEDPADHERATDDHRLHVAAALADPDEVQVAHREQETRCEKHHGEEPEQANRAVDQIDAEQRADAAPHVLCRAADQPAGAGRRVDLDRHVDHPQVRQAGLDDRLQRVGVAGEDVQLQRRLARHGAKAAGGIVHVGPAQRPNHAAADALQQPLDR